jgi:hypothetical protein
VDLIQLAQGTDQWQAMAKRDPIKGGDLTERLSAF